MLNENLNQYKKKYYLNLILKGSISAFTIFLSCFYFVNILEFLGNFGSIPRAILFYIFILVVFTSFYFWIFIPLYKLINKNKQITDSEAAIQIGNYFPQIKDKLLNALQLEQNKGNTDLIQASLAQRKNSIQNYEFSKAVDLSNNRKYFKLLAIPIVVILFTLIFEPKFFLESTPRIINYNQKFELKAPFNFNVVNEELSTFKNENFNLQLNIEGSAIPEAVQLITDDGRKLKMIKEEDGSFSLLFKKIQKEVNFHFEASGFKSSDYHLQVFTRPSLRDFSVYLNYPDYIKKKGERIDNTGNLIIPEGTEVEWQFKTLETNKLNLKFQKEEGFLEAGFQTDNSFKFNKTISESETYQVLLENKYSKNKDVIEFYLNVIPDEFPTINMRPLEDTVMFDFLLLGGNIGDDYGITALNLKYKIKDNNLTRTNNDTQYKSISINFNPVVINQSFFYKLDLKDLNINQGNQLEYYVEVWDNDGVNGRKRTKSSLYSFKFPSKKEFKEAISKDSESTENQIENALEQSKDLKKDLKDLQNKLKGKKKLEWQDKKNIEKLVEKNEQIKKEVQKLQELNQQLNQKNEKFNPRNEELAQKAEQLQKLMDELLDEETKKLYDQLNELLEQNYINQDLQDLLKDIEVKEESLEKELERALELFKKLKFDSKAEEIIKELEELAKEQEKLAEETEDSKKSDLDEIQKEQEELNEKFDDVKKELDELNEINESLENQKNLENFEKQEQSIEQEQKNIQENLEQNKKKKASDSQQKNSEKMQKMAQQMQQMQQSMQMQQLNENYDDLRKILENLITLSFNQEDLMLEFQKIKRIDPKFIKLGQEQLKIKDDAKIIEDSLVALSKRVFQIESFVTREVTEMNRYMNESLDAIKKRTPEIAASKQQFTMTSINNLALLLNDILKQMQQQMSQSMSGQQMSEKQGGSPKLSDLQKQLNQRIENLKKSGKSGKQLSEELAKLAAEQEMIRNAMKQGMGKGQPGKEGGKQEGKQGEKEGEGTEGSDGKEGGKDGDGGYKELLEKMEKTEEDLVNKKVTNELLERQAEILTRLLESEKAEKERELDNKREAKTAEQKDKNPPSDFSDYLKMKEMQIELLKTIPTSLNQYYKKQVNEYFKKIKN
ncbi:DUF4175 family protein [Flexithrix dorotheae]|uniref:DUF4175 family protein n=1 Tax=Flexithrix dorotheae TaxID=70993 RepID=UPI0003746CD8|nr:hypothetical protein [Flexithrix dorotheae]